MHVLWIPLGYTSMYRSLALLCLIKTGRSRVIICHSRAIESLVMGNLFMQSFHMERLVPGGNENGLCDIGRNM
jgi:hypothetical protein